jgi:reductive dehalogenase
METPPDSPRAHTRRSFFKKAGLAALAAGLGKNAASSTTPAEPARSSSMPYTLRDDIKQFSSNNTVFRRIGWDPTTIGYRRGMLEAVADKVKSGRPGFSRVDYAAFAAAWTFQNNFGHAVYNDEVMGKGFMKKLVTMPKYHVQDEQLMSRQVKKIGKLFGASLVGIAPLNRLWLYEEANANIGPDYKNVIVCAIEMDYDAIMTSPAASCSATTGNAYSRMVFTAACLAQFIRALGWNAYAAGNGAGLAVPMAIEAGLGEAGRHGLLITPAYGSRVRLCKVFTDMPLAPDHPIAFGVTEFCEVCKKCADDCPPRAISDGPRTFDGVCTSNNPGALKWYVHVEKCYNYWCDNGAECSNCIRSCPFNKPQSWIHDMARLPVRAKSTALDRALRAMDDLMGYGEQKDPVRRYWESDRFIHTGGYVT